MIPSTLIVQPSLSAEITKLSKKIDSDLDAVELLLKKLRSILRDSQKWMSEGSFSEVEYCRSEMEMYHGHMLVGISRIVSEEVRSMMSNPTGDVIVTGLRHDAVIAAESAVNKARDLGEVASRVVKSLQEAIAVAKMPADFQDATIAAIKLDRPALLPGQPPMPGDSYALVRGLRCIGCPEPLITVSNGKICASSISKLSCGHFYHKGCALQRVLSTNPCVCGVLSRWEPTKFGSEVTGAVTMHLPYGWKPDDVVDCFKEI